MKIEERKEKLSEIESILKSFIGSEKKYEGLSAFYFMPHCFAREDQGIHCIYNGKDDSVIEDLLGYVDIPAMMNGFLIETVKSKTNNSFHLFIYDNEQFHIDNLKQLNILNTHEILSASR